MNETFHSFLWTELKSSQINVWKSLDKKLPNKSGQGLYHQQKLISLAATWNCIASFLILLFLLLLLGSQTYKMGWETLHQLNPILQQILKLGLPVWLVSFKYYTKRLCFEVASLPVWSVKNELAILTNIFVNLHRNILQFVQIYFAIWTNIFYNSWF